MSSSIGLGARGALIVLAPALLAAQTPAMGAVAGRATAQTDSAAPSVPAAGAVVSVAGRPGSARLATMAGRGRPARKG